MLVQTALYLCNVISPGLLQQAELGKSDLRFGTLHFLLRSCGLRFRCAVLKGN